MKAYINGIGMISACGPKLEDFASALESGVAPETDDNGLLMVDMKRVDKSELKKLRRADKLSKMAVVAARQAMADAALIDAPANVSPDAPVDAGLILATSLGPHTTTFSFLDDILEYGDAGVSPTTFSNSVHNAAASYIAAECGIMGPTLTVTQFMLSFHEALALGLCWLREGLVPRVLVGAVDVHGEVLGHVANRMLKDEAAYVPGEGAVFFMLEREAAKGYASVVRAETGFSDGVIKPSDGTLLMLDDDGMLKDGKKQYDAIVPAGAEVIRHNKFYGSLMTGSAFGMASAALMLKNGKTSKAIEILRLACSGRRGIIRLEA